MSGKPRFVLDTKLPDAIIGATALCRKAILITNDSHFSGIPVLTVQGC